MKNLVKIIALCSGFIILIRLLRFGPVYCEDVFWPLISFVACLIILKFGYNQSIK